MKYYNEDIEEYLEDPQEYEDRAKMFNLGGCMPVGINNTFISPKKFDSSNLEKTQYNIRERFGHLQSEDKY